MHHINSNDTRHIFGSRHKNPTGFLFMGRFYALDGSHGKNVYLDAQSPHVISVFGKRGYGKSYTVGVLIEEFSRLPQHIKNYISLVIIDSLGIYWTMNHSNNTEQNSLKKWKINPKGIEINLFSPQIHTTEHDVQTKNQIPFSIPASIIPAEIWCELFQVDPTSQFGIVLVKTIHQLNTSKTNFTINDIFDRIKKNHSIPQETKDIADNYYYYVKNLGIFSHHNNNSIQDILKPGTINCIDLSMLPSTHVKQIITGVLADILFQKRIHARKQEEQGYIQNKEITIDIPKIWMAIDEAQLFLPKQNTNHSKKILIEQWLRQGRQPGLTLILATQQPSALDPEVFSHSDIIICHRLTSQKDIRALQQIRPSYLHENISAMIEKMGYDKGVCTIIDDTMEQVHICKIRPRFTWHGGNEPKIGKKPSIKEDNISDD